MCADHGDAFGEDGFHGRRIAHPVVMNVPYTAMLRGRFFHPWADGD